MPNTKKKAAKKAPAKKKPSTNVLPGNFKGAQTSRTQHETPNKSNAKKAAPAKKRADHSATPSGRGAPSGDTSARRKRNELSEKGIRRLDTKPTAAKQTHGYQVCATIDGVPHTKLFSDSTAGGRQEALNAARHYRDSLALPISPRNV